MKNLFFLALTLLMFSTAPTSAAAEAPTATLTQMRWQKGSLDLVHFLPLPDATEVLSRIDDSVEVFSTEGLTLLTLYVSATFSMSDDNGAIRAENIIAEADDDFIYLYQVAEIDAVSGELVVDSQIFRDLTTEAVTYINIESDSGSILQTVSGDVPARLGAQPFARQAVSF
jgi:hypothetical protein